MINNVSSADVLRYTEADVIPCSGNHPRDADERKALRGIVLKYARTHKLDLFRLIFSIFSLLKTFLFFKSGEAVSRLSPEQTKPVNSGEPKMCFIK